MTFGDAAWHFLNFYAPAFGVGLLAASLAKLLWRAELRATSWLRLAGAAAAANAGALTLGLLLFGRDGRTASYGLMLLATTAALWLTGLRQPRP